MQYLYIALGGAAGALARYAVSHAMGDNAIPLATLTVNIAGCLLLGFFLTITLEILPVDSRLRTGVATGFLGALTTFSTFIAEIIHLALQDRPVAAIVYLFISLSGGIAAAYTGVFCARWIELARIYRAKGEEEK